MTKVISPASIQHIRFAATSFGLSHTHFCMSAAVSPPPQRRLLFSCRLAIVRVRDQKSQKRPVTFTASLPEIRNSSDTQALRGPQNLARLVLYVVARHSAASDARVAERLSPIRPHRGAKKKRRCYAKIFREGTYFRDRQLWESLPHPPSHLRVVSKSRTRHIPRPRNHAEPIRSNRQPTATSKLRACFPATLL
jgi:hypothetical protein